MISLSLSGNYRVSPDLEQNNWRLIGTNVNVMRILAWLVSVFLMTVSTGSLAMDTRFLQGLGDAHYTRIESEILARHFHVFVMLPDGYEQSPEEDYPTIYLLDGGALFPLLSAYYRYLNFGEEIPDAIVVGISYGSDSFEEGNYRSTDYTAKSPERDYWGGADKFQSFLSDEFSCKSMAKKKQPANSPGYLWQADPRMIRVSGSRPSNGSSTGPTTTTIPGSSRP